MEKIKSFLLGSSKEEEKEAKDETGQPSSTHGGVTGAGSHFDNTTETQTTGIGGNHTAGHGNTPLSTAGSQPHPDAKSAAIAAAGLGSSQQTSGTSAIPTSHLASQSQSYPTESQTQNNNLGNAQIGSGPIGQSASSGLTRPDTSSSSANTNTTQAGHGSIGQSALSGLTGSDAGSAATTTSTQTGPSVTGSSQTSGSHLGRDAALMGGAGGGAGALGSGVASHREREMAGGHGSSTAAPGLGQSSGLGSGTGTSNTTSSTLPIRTHESTNPHGVSSGTGYGSRQEPSITGPNHATRDTAALGTAGAVGAGVHHHDSHAGPTGLGQGSIAQSSTHGPHTTNAANLLDPRVNPSGLSGHEDAIKHSPNHGGGAEQADSHHRASEGLTGSAKALQETREGDHGNVTNTSGLGSSTARTGVPKSAVSSGLGASNTGAGVSHQSATSTGPAPHTAGPHSKDYQNVLDPRVTPLNAAAKGNEQTSTSSGQHYSRDAAVAGGVGTAAYAATQQHGSRGARDPAATQLDQQSTWAESGVPHSTTSTNQSGLTTHTSANEVTTDHSKDHHYGRDAAVAGGAAGAGAGAYEADRHSHEIDLKKAQKEAEKEHKAFKQAEKDYKHAEKQAAKDHKAAEKQAEKDYDKAEKEAEEAEKDAEKTKKAGFLSFLHRDKSKKYTKEEEDDFDRQEREHNASQQSHAGRNVAAGGAAGAAGTGALYELHHEQGKPAASEDPYATTSTNKTPLPDKPIGKDLGDHLHGADRNRGVAGSSGFAGEPGFGDGTTGADHGGLLHDHDPSKYSISHQQSGLTGAHGTSALAGSSTGHQQSGHRQSGLTSSQGHSGVTGSSGAVGSTGREFPLVGAGGHGHEKHDTGVANASGSGHDTATQPRGMF
ncbi:uncharacterized protein L3040_002576 [Drepanopeziza brunnea f. sp. 'multigermtubi']|uniref:uncharacterized protein n=1 Tax=Drepanopeziza brunnea f. sp. 'multigermtubi' TaxID=698441 RepID=UPI002395E1C5|nr:hypothetical protein L3040_002576 [Drepanopeziza brunnea f. sp. 'multigermtubi']